MRRIKKLTVFDTILTIVSSQRMLLSRKEISNLFTTQFLTTLFPAMSGKQSTEQIYIEEVTTDSRNTTSNGLFIPIVGERFDGHTFIEEAVKNGAVAALWQKDRPIPEIGRASCRERALISGVNRGVKST